MATQLQIRRGTAAQVAAFTGAEGEIVYNSTNDSLHTNDGSTAGGFELARVDGSNFSSSVSFTTLSAATFSVSGAATFTGIDVTGLVAADSLTVDNFTLDGTTLALSSGDFTVDVAGDIILDADGGQVTLSDAGSAKYVFNMGTNQEIDVSGSLNLDLSGDFTVNADGGDILYSDASVNFGKFTNDSQNFVIQAGTSDKDIIFKGTDDSTVITALTLDMSAAGAATFNSNVIVPDNSYFLFGDTTSGIQGNSSSDFIKFYTANTARFQIASGGDVSFYEDTGSTAKFFWDASAESLGIGATPNQILTLDKASGDVFTRFDKSGAIKGLIGIADSTGSGSTASVQGDMIVRGQTNVLLDTAGTTRVKIDSSGNVGIGTASPQRALHINNAGASSTKIQITNASTGATTDGDGFQIGIGNDGTANIEQRENLGLNFSTNNTTRMTINSAGLVGIGVTSPSYPLEVQSGGVGTVLRAGTSFVSIDSTGSASSPSLIFNGDGDTGIYRSGSDALTIATAGTDRLTIASNGAATFSSSVTAGGNIVITGDNVLDVTQGNNSSFFKRNASQHISVVSDSSQHRLLATGSSDKSFIIANTTGAITFSPANTVAFNIAADGAATFTPAAGGHAVFNENSVDADFRVESDTNANALFVQGSDGRIGVGTGTSLDNQLEVAGGNVRVRGTTTPSLKFNNNELETLAIKLNSGSTGTLGLRDNKVLIDSNGGFITNPIAGGHAVFNENGVDADFRVESDGYAHMLFVDASTNRVGIANSLPAQSLDIGVGGLQIQGNIASPASGTNAMQVDYFGGGARYWSRGADTGVRGTHKFYTLTNTGGSQITPLIIDNTGGVIINEDSADADFRVESNNKSHMLFVDASLDFVGFETNTRINSSATTAFLAPAGHICIETQVSGGNGYYGMWLHNLAGTQTGYIYNNGSATSYNTASDGRLKENILDAEDAGSLIDDIQVRSFDWKETGEHQRYGMIAQELQTVAPEAVHEPEDADAMMAVDYSVLVPMLIKEIQSLRARVADLES